MAAITCSEPDCERPARGRGLCGTHYAYKRRHGTLPPLPPRVTICTAPGCENPIGPAGARGLCPKHYQRVTKSKRGLQQPPRTAPLRERFYAKVSNEPCSCGCDCRLWIGGLSYDGYGHFSIGNKSYNAHRVAYELEVGPIPDGLQIDHVYEAGCRHRNCVKREHLEAVTVTINNQRMPMTPRRFARLSAAGRKGSAIRWGKPPPPG